MKHRVSTIIIIFFISLLTGSVSWGDTDRLPKALVLMPGNEHAIIVEKKTQTLYVYSKNTEDVKLSFKVSCSTGEVAGPKTKAGDKKTPEGVYFLKDEYEDRYLTPIYGKKAFPSDYPNLLDLRLGKQGSAIWIHGTDKPLKPMDSNGCVALENNNILELSQYINLDATPLIIVEQIEYVSAKKLQKEKKRILKFLEKWALSLGTRSYHKYLSFYDENYLPEISWWEDWLGLRRKSSNDPGKTPRIELSNTGIYAQGGVTVVLTDMNLSIGDSGGDDQKRYLGKRQLFIKEGKNGPIIVGDLFQKRAESYASGETPLVAAARELIRDESTNEVLVETVEQWLAAWSAKDMAEYAAFYASDFYSEGLSKKAWVRRKKQLAKKYDYISVTGQDYKVTQKKDGYEVSFLQKYESSGFSTQGRKQLKLVRKGGVWKIYRENWKGK
ncbi:MAG: L,D-transpeptidase family protein [Desulfobacterales bacterium]|nr:L,D-transpeptidase family protein [Desulfobacterales bacterium]